MRRAAHLFSRLSSKNEHQVLPASKTNLVGFPERESLIKCLSDSPVVIRRNDSLGLSKSRSTGAASFELAT